MKCKKKIAIIGNPTDIHLERRLKKINFSHYEMTVISLTHLQGYINSNFNFFSININCFRFFKNFQLFYAYAHFIYQENFDVIYCFGALSPLAWIAGFLANKYIIVSTLGADVYLNDQQYISKIIEWNVKKLIQSADLITVLSSSMRSKLEDQFQVSSLKIHEDFYDIEPIWYQNITSVPQKKFSDKRPIIYSPRMLHPLYQQSKIIQALSLIKQQYPNVLLLQSGYNIDLNYQNICKKLVRALNLQNNFIILPSYKETLERINIFDVADIIIMIPKSDGMPASMIEAWARKKPVIVSDIENYDEKYNREFFLKTFMTVPIMAKTINDLLKNKPLQSYLTNTAFNFLQQKKLEASKDLFKYSQNFSVKNVSNKIFRGILFLCFLFEPWFKFKSKKN